MVIYLIDQKISKESWKTFFKQLSTFIWSKIEDLLKRKALSENTELGGKKTPN